MQGSFFHWLLVGYSNYLTSFTTFDSAQLAGVLHITSLERVANNKHSNLLVQFKFFLQVIIKKTEKTEGTKVNADYEASDSEQKR
jgi:hypothetical protein